MYPLFSMAKDKQIGISMWFCFNDSIIRRINEKNTPKIKSIVFWVNVRIGSLHLFSDARELSPIGCKPSPVIQNRFEN